MSNVLTILEGLTPLQPETLLGTNLLEVSIWGETFFGALKGLSRSPAILNHFRHKKRNPPRDEKLP